MSKRIITDCTKVKQQNQALIQVNAPLFGHLINPDYVEPPYDNWFHPKELAQVQAKRNVVTKNESSSSTSDTILPISEETDSDESRDFSSDHYERLAHIPLSNAGKRLKSTAQRQRRKSVRDPPSGSVLRKRTLVDASSDSDFNSDPKAPKLMAASIDAAQSSQGVEDATFVTSLIVTPPGSKEQSSIHTPVPPMIPTPSTSVPQSSAGPSKPSDSERITFLESQVLALQNQVDTLVSTDTQ
ncbi:hypothetical protein L1987_15278 [Smallanthus sonchifolius]|uniref:Uncharacterized protein n=1 Tax=Smallanthus sonchifolius TaxID=185202 RepID=A0ACB9J521_9ASTR|nr:hypothetical protein L1987_15278 [Smallanthus sonchifolius]